LYLPSEFSEEPDEWLLELIVGLGRDIVVLQVLLSVESDLLGLNLSVLDINFVSYENNWNVLTNSDEILIPLWDVLVSDSWADVEHDDTAVSVDVVSISESSELLLTGSVPNVEKDLTFEVKKGIGCTSTPRVAMYFFSNSPVKCLLTKVVFPTPPSPTRTSLNSMSY
jgi:hypothetical protein